MDEPREDSWGAPAFQDPPPSLRERILKDTAPVPFVFLRRGQGFWLSEDDGRVASRVLFHDSRERWSTRLIRVDTHALTSPPAMAGHRTLVVIDGVIEQGGQRLEVGDLVREAVSPGAWCARAPAVLFEQVDAAGGTMASGVVRRTARREVPLAPGVRVTPLHTQLNVIRAEPGAVLPSHEHPGIEELFVLEGDCVVEAERLEVGDYHRALAGSTHGPTAAGANGCVLLCAVRTEDPARRSV